MGRIFEVRPSSWEVDHAHALAVGERFAEAHDGELPHNGFWRDLERRCDRNADAFAINHPNFKLFLDHLMIERQHVPGPVVELGALTAQPEPPAVASVPEPSSLALTCVAVAVLYIVIGWQNRRPIEAQARGVIGWILARGGEA